MPVVKDHFCTQPLPASSQPKIPSELPLEPYERGLQSDDVHHLLSSHGNTSRYQDTNNVNMAPKYIDLDDMFDEQDSSYDISGDAIFERSNFTKEQEILHKKRTRQRPLNRLGVWSTPLRALHRKGHIDAMIVQAHGTTKRQKCGCCESGKHSEEGSPHGPFTDCVVWSGYFDNACGNCIWDGYAVQCSYSKSFKQQGKGFILDDDEEETEPDRTSERYPARERKKPELYGVKTYKIGKGEPGLT